MRYRMIGVDLDGTLLDPSGRITPATRRAIHRAADAGVMVVPCTGRAWCEARRVLDGHAPIASHGVFVTGASICEIESGAPCDTALLDTEDALEIVDILSAADEAVLVFQDVHRAGWDYLVTGSGKLTPNTEWWFENSGARVRHERKVDGHVLQHTLRVSLVTSPGRVDELANELDIRFGQKLSLHYIAAVTVPDYPEALSILEIFGQGVDKWTGLQRLAAMMGIDDQHIAVIGDEVNDHAMLQHAGCPIVMGNANPAVQALGRYTTRPNDQDGVAYAIDQLLDGQWV